MYFTYTHINTQPNTHPKHVALHVRSAFVWVQKCVLVCERARLLICEKHSAKFFQLSFSLARFGSSQINGTQHSLEMPTERRENHRSHFNQHPFVYIWSTSWTKLCTNNSHRSLVHYFLGVSLEMASHSLNQLPTAALTTAKMWLLLMPSWRWVTTDGDCGLPILRSYQFTSHFSINFAILYSPKLFNDFSLSTSQVSRKPNEFIAFTYSE